LGRGGFYHTVAIFSPARQAYQLQICDDLSVYFAANPDQVKQDRINPASSKKKKMAESTFYAKE